MPDTKADQDNALKVLISRGLTALKSAAELAVQSTSEVQRAVSNPDLISALRAEGQMYEHWLRRIERALDGLASTGDSGPVILKAIYDVGQKVRQEAPDSKARDLEIVESSQLALHTWIVTFGAMRLYASHLDMSQTEQDMQASMEKAKQADALQSEIARKILVVEA